MERRAGMAASESQTLTLPGSAALHAEPASSALAPSLLNLILRHAKLVRLWVGAIPVALALLLFAIKRNEWIAGLKQPLEETALFVLGFGILGTLARYAATRHPFFLWYAGLCAAFFWREVHLKHSSTVMYLALAILFVWAWRKYERLCPYLGSRLLNSVVFMTLVSYIGSQVIDKNFRPELLSDRYLYDPIEESLEILGHAALALAAWTVRAPSNAPAET